MYVLPYGQMSLWGISMPQMYNFLFYFFIFIGLLLISPINVSSNIINTVTYRLRSLYRIGPHNKEVLSVIFGSLLGDSHAEKRLKGVGTRFSFNQESSHIEYIYFLHEFFSLRGYCNSKKPIQTTRLGFGGKVRKVARFATFTYISFNWIHDLWYKNNVKVVPSCIGEYLTPLALAIWLMDDGSKVGKGFKFSTNCFTYDECLLLIKVLKDNFKIKSTIQQAGAENQYIIYVWKESMDNLIKIVYPHVIPEMRYKINT